MGRTTLNPGDGLKILRRAVGEEKSAEVAGAAGEVFRRVLDQIRAEWEIARDDPPTTRKTRQDAAGR